MSYQKYDGSTATETAAPTNNLYGSSSVETLTGSAAAEGFWGSSGDSLVGGAGDDTFYFQGESIRVAEAAGGGVDKIISWSNVNLANTPNVENLDIGGNNTYGAGTAANNVIVATGTNQEIYGGGGQDVLVGSASGADTFIVVKGEGNDAIYSFDTAKDVIRLGGTGYSSFAQVQSHMSQVGADVKIDLGGSDAVIVRGVTTGQFTAANFQLQLDAAKLAPITFSDEFNGTQLSIWDRESNPTGVWRPDYGYAGSQGESSYTLPTNGELQIYVSPYFRDAPGDYAVNPFSEAGGALTISARPAPAGATDLWGQNYTSGMITTKETFAQTYGYFEMRADIPSNVGGWPAFWLLPADGSWPPELDVMEVLTKDAGATFTTSHSNVGNNHTMDQGISFVPETTDGFHTYGVLWTKTDLVWYLDGSEVFRAATPADMNKPMYMLANLALGGWGGSVDKSQLPAEMKIDYIRAYGLADGSSSVAYDTVHSGGATTGSTVSGTTGGASTGGTTADPVISTGSTGATGSTTSTGSTGSTASSNDPQLLTASGPNSVLTGGAGADTINASEGYDTLTGGAGADKFVFRNEPWAPIHITDFHVGEDKIDLSALLQKSGYTGSDPVAGGYVYLTSDGDGGTIVRFDRDGTGANPQWPNTIIDLEHVSPAGLTWAQLQGSAAASTSTGSTGSTTSTGSTGATSPTTTTTVGETTASTGSTGATTSTVAPATSGGGGGGVWTGGSATVTSSGVTETTTASGGKLMTAAASGGPLDGGSGGDTIQGASDAANYIRGFEGDDRITGGMGFNQINGNIGNDTISGRSLTGDDLMGGQGEDVISTASSTAHNLVNGNRGNDTITGSNAGDTLRGGQGDDLISGGSGADWISGDRGFDTVSGGGGADVFHQFVGGGVTTVTDFNYAQGDRVHLDLGATWHASQQGSNVVVDLDGGGELILRDVRLDTFGSGWIFTN